MMHIYVENNSAYLKVIEKELIRFSSRSLYKCPSTKYGVLYFFFEWSMVNYISS